LIDAAFWGLAFQTIQGDGCTIAAGSSLMLPVICLSQTFSNACLSINFNLMKLRMAQEDNSTTNSSSSSSSQQLAANSQQPVPSSAMALELDENMPLYRLGEPPFVVWTEKQWKRRRIDDRKKHREKKRLEKKGNREKKKEKRMLHADERMVERAKAMERKLGQKEVLKILRRIDRDTKREQKREQKMEQKKEQMEVRQQQERREDAIVTELVNMVRRMEIGSGIEGGQRFDAIRLRSHQIVPLMPGDGVSYVVRRLD
jgi:hypothetical protein